MKKALIITIMIIISFSLTGQKKEQRVKEMYEKAYIYKEKSLLISKSEFNCSFFITDKITEDIIPDVEKQAELFYREKAKETESSSERDILNKIADEEHRHWQVLENVIQFVRSPREFLENAEWSDVDDK